MRDYLVIEVRDQNYVDLVIVDEKFYYETYKEKLVSENKKSRVISNFEYFL